jgi:hypothetical protein
MIALLDLPAYGPRDDARFLSEMNALTIRHLRGCLEYERIWRGWTTGTRSEHLPFLHAALFKEIELVTKFGPVSRGRTLFSSGTSDAPRSRIVLDLESSASQKRSATRIFEDFLGPQRGPVVVLDSAESLRRRGEISARTAAAMSLAPLATELHFALPDPERPESMAWDVVESVAGAHEAMTVYGITSTLWQAWIENWGGREALRKTRVTFVHSGGWKKLESRKVSPERFSEALLETSGPGSRVLDFYGLVEQVGVPYPLCERNCRHVPAWADVLVRNPFTLESVSEESGMLQLMNTLATGAPYHSVLTEDLGRLIPGTCECGRMGKRFELLGRIPKAEIRGCANV